jgi:hypothetical protein
MILTLKQVAERCGVSEYVVREWIKSGELRAINHSVSSTSKKPRLKVRSDDLDAFNAVRSTHHQLQPPTPRKKKIAQGSRIKFYEEA